MTDTRATSDVAATGGRSSDDLLVRLFGWRAAFIHGNTTTLDRWRYLRRRLPRVRSTGERVLDVGCGSGAFTIAAATRGYHAVGLSWDERNQAAAERRAGLAGVGDVSFPICDVRRLDARGELVGCFDIAICFETIEHVRDDRKLLRDIHRCLKPGGRLYLSTPNYHYRSSDKDMGPFSAVEDGGHVRRGYSPAMLRELCGDAGFDIEEITYVSQFFSQVVTRWQTWLARVIGNKPQWLMTLPLRWLPVVFDPWLGRWIGRVWGWPGYSIALAAYKPRFDRAGAR